MSGYLGDLDEEQQTALEEMKQRITAFEGKMQELADNLINDPIILRFLRARKFDVDLAYDMLFNMMKFRIEFQDIGVGALDPSMCENELQTGKSFFYDYDKDGRPLCYIRTRLHDPYASDALENQRYCILMIEYGKTLLLPPGETVTVVFDMTKATVRNIDIKSVHFMVTSLQNYYPESLGKILVLNATWIVNSAWKLIKPWLDPVTAAKVNFIRPEELTQYIDPNKLPLEYGGNDTFVYEYDSYRQRFWNALKPKE